MQQLKTITKNPYIEFKEKQSKILNNFPQFFAFSNEQFKEGLKKLNVTEKDILSTGYGGFIKKTDKENYLKMFKDSDKSLKELFKDDDFLYNAFKYELGNHEFIITYDFEDTLSVLGFEYNKLTERELNILEKAKSDYIEQSEENE